MRTQLTAAKFLNADVLMLDGPTGHSGMNDTSGLRTGWRTSLAASSVPHTTRRLQQWRFTGNDVCENLEFKTEELPVDEATARAAKWCIDSVSGRTLNWKTLEYPVR